MASGIRRFLSVPYDERIWECDGLQTVGRLVETPVGDNILARLADLIDRPTTTRHGRFKKRHGLEVPLCEVRGQAIGDSRWNYCPKCGAAILEVGE